MKLKFHRVRAGYYRAFRQVDGAHVADVENGAAQGCCSPREWLVTLYDPDTTRTDGDIQPSYWASKLVVRSHVAQLPDPIQVMRDKLHDLLFHEGSGSEYRDNTLEDEREVRSWYKDDVEEILRSFKRRRGEGLDKAARRLLGGLLP